MANVYSILTLLILAGFQARLGNGQLADAVDDLGDAVGDGIEDLGDTVSDAIGELIGGEGVDKAVKVTHSARNSPSSDDLEEPIVTLMNNLRSSHKTEDKNEKDTAKAMRKTTKKLVNALKYTTDKLQKAIRALKSRSNQ